MLAPHASFGCPWGDTHHGARLHDILIDESRLIRRVYLDNVPIERIA